MVEHKFISGHIEGLRLALDDMRIHEHKGLMEDLSKYFEDGWELDDYRLVPRDTNGFWVMFHLTRD